MIKKLKKIDYKYYLCFIITIFFLSYFFKFSNSLNCLFDGIKDLLNSLKYYFLKLIDFNSSVTVSVDKIPISLKNAKLPFLPKDWNLFLLKLKIYFRSIFNSQNFSSYTSSFLLFILNFLKIFMLLSPLFIILYFQIQKYYNQNEDNINKETKFLLLYKKIENKFLYPIIYWFRNFKLFLKENKKIIILWICLWLFYFNVFTIIIELLAYYIYFTLSFDFLNLYIQVYKFLLYLTPLLEFFPIIFWIIIFFYFLNKFRLNIGYERLEHFEMMDRGFINSTGQVTMCCGSMGKGKTSLITDMSLSQTSMFRDKSFEKLLENDLKFSNFNWYNLEMFIKDKMNDHTIYNLSTIRNLIKKLRFYFEASLDLDDISTKSIKRYLKKKYRYNFKNLIFDYELEKYSLFYDDNLKLHYIWDVIENYALLYFVYIINSSLLVTNYSIREEIVINDLGNFPIWNNDFFRKNPYLSEAYSRHSHILDFDMLRLGKKIIENNIKSNAFEFGVVVITEGGKERKNTLELKETKKNVDETNQKNDLFNMWLKMARHLATIDNYPFIKVFIDEQRPESLGADVRELCEKIVFIKEKEDLKSVLPFFVFDVMFYELFENKFKNFYKKYRYYRNDKTLLMYLYKKIFTKIHHRHVKLINTFGYNRLVLESEKGTLDNQFEENNYYLMHKKIYSKRFATDAFSDFFVNKSVNCPIGLNDFEEYKTEKASIDELAKQNSYFINDLLKH